jgi:hypothetical protein
MNFIRYSPSLFQDKLGVTEIAGGNSPRQPNLITHMALSTFTLDAARTCLAEYTCLDSRSLTTSTDQLALQQALLLVGAASDRQLFGICADSLVQGMEALRSYLRALEYEPEKYADTYMLEPIDGPVFIKCNPERGKCYRESYTGQHRGVLVSCQSDLEDGLNETYGHLPLNLWDEM